MRTNCCHNFFAFNIKFLNFFQFFVGVSAVIYSAYLLNQWQNQSPFVPSPPEPEPLPPAPVAPAPDYVISLYSNGGLVFVGDELVSVDLVSGLDSGSDLISQLYSIQLPAPWFIYAVMVVGVLLCCISCIGHIAAEAINGCCLCFYIALELVIILLEAALVAFIAIDKQWEKDLPLDQTGQLEKLKSFVEKYADMCKWLGITLLVVQALSLLLSLVLRAMISTQRADSDVESDYVAAGDRIREPLLSSQPNQSSGLMKGDSKEHLSDSWTARIRQKYGLKNNESSRQQSFNASSSTRA